MQLLAEVQDQQCGKRTLLCRPSVQRVAHEGVLAVLLMGACSGPFQLRSVSAAVRPAAGQSSIGESFLMAQGQAGAPGGQWGLVSQLLSAPLPGEGHNISSTAAHVCRAPTFPRHSWVAAIELDSWTAVILDS